MQKLSFLSEFFRPPYCRRHWEKNIVATPDTKQERAILPNYARYLKFHKGMFSRTYSDSSSISTFVSILQDPSMIYVRETFLGLSRGQQPHLFELEGRPASSRHSALALVWAVMACCRAALLLSRVAVFGLQPGAVVDGHDGDDGHDDDDNDDHADDGVDDADNKEYHDDDDKVDYHGDGCHDDHDDDNGHDDDDDDNGDGCGGEGKE